MNETPRKLIFVLAGHREEFERYLNENGLTDSEAKYIYEPQQTWGRIPTEVVVVGPFYDRKDAHKLKDAAMERLSLSKSSNL